MQTTASGNSRNMGANCRNIRWNTAVPGGNRGNGYINDKSKKYWHRAATVTPNHSLVDKLHHGLSFNFLEHNLDSFVHISVFNTAAKAMKCLGICDEVPWADNYSMSVPSSKFRYLCLVLS